MSKRKAPKKPFSKLSITELKQQKANEKRKATILKKKIDEGNKTEQRKIFNEVIEKNKKVEKLEIQIEKKKLQNKIKSNQQLIQRNKGKDKTKVMRAEFEIEVIQEKIKNENFKTPEIEKNIDFEDEEIEGDFFTFSSAFYYFNETKKKILELYMDKQLKSLNGKKSIKSISELINSIFLGLNSESAVKIHIDINNGKAFINRTTMEEAQDETPLINKP